MPFRPTLPQQGFHSETLRGGGEDVRAGGGDGQGGLRGGLLGIDIGVPPLRHVATFEQGLGENSINTGV